MKKYKVTFHDIFDAESEEDCFAQLIQGMWSVVYHEDVTAFEIEEVEGADEKSKRVLNEIQTRWKHPLRCTSRLRRPDQWPAPVTR